MWVSGPRYRAPSWRVVLSFVALFHLARAWATGQAWWALWATLVLLALVVGIELWQRRRRTVSGTPLGSGSRAARRSDDTSLRAE